MIRGVSECEAEEAEAVREEKRRRGGRATRATRQNSVQAGLWKLVVDGRRLALTGQSGRAQLLEAALPALMDHAADFAAH